MTLAAGIWILGASDPEMAEIERVLLAAGERVEYAVSADGTRVHPGNAYRAVGPTAEVLVDAAIYTVECRIAGVTPVRAIDHHSPGDHGFGRGPQEFLPASSLGQVLSELAAFGRWDSAAEVDSVHYSAPGSIYHVDGRWVVDGLYGSSPVPRRIVQAAAADHCLGAAYRGECPGVDPDALMEWRAASRAAFQGVSTAEVLARVEAAAEELRAASELVLSEAGEGLVVRDMRRDQPVPELPEAATRLGISYISGPLIGPDGRRKYTLSGTAEVVEAFLGGWAARNGLVDLYGDPARGFAGGYADLPGERSSGTVA
jgi:hypothetical protein